MPIRRAMSFVSVALVFSVSLVLAGCSRAGEPSSTPAARGSIAASESFMFILQAQGGSISADNGSQKTFTFTLKEPDPVVIFLSDRPKRLVGHVPLQLFVQGWNVMGFTDQPPNAAAIVSEAAKDDTVIIELARPEWNVADVSLSFQARVVQNEKNGAEPAFTSSYSDAKLPVTFGHLSLFIDPSRQRSIEFIVTPNGVIELRENYKDAGRHPIEVIPQMSFLPEYYEKLASTPSPSNATRTPTPTPKTR